MNSALLLAGVTSSWLVFSRLVVVVVVVVAIDAFAADLSKRHDCMRPK